MDRMKIVCMGDSLTFGYGVASSQSWFALLKKKYPQITWVNAGQNGDTTSGMIARLGEDVIDEHPKYVLLMGGTNDVFEGTPLQVIKDNLQYIAERCTCEGIIPILVVMPPVFPKKIDSGWGSQNAILTADEKLQELASWMNSRSEKKLGIDLRVCFLKAAQEEERNIAKMFPDGIHMNRDGHALAAECISKGIEDLV